MSVVDGIPLALTDVLIGDRGFLNLGVFHTGGCYSSNVTQALTKVVRKTAVSLEYACVCVACVFPSCWCTSYVQMLVMCRLGSLGKWTHQTVEYVL